MPYNETVLIELIQLIQERRTKVFILEKGGVLHEQLQKTIKKYIANGILESDEQLPSVRALAKELTINPNTVQRAYSNLEKEGIVYTVGGKGVFVSPKEESMKSISHAAQEEFKEKAQAMKSVGVTYEEALKLLKNIYDGGSNK